MGEDGRNQIARLAHEAAARFGVDAASLELICDAPEGEGAVYRGLVAGRPVIVKIGPLRPEALPAAQEKVDFVRYLAQRGAPVARPLLSVSSALLEVLPAGDTLLGVTASEWLPGSPPSSHDPVVWTPTLFRRWGATAGQLHALTRCYARGYPRADLQPPPTIMSWREEHASFCEMCHDRDVLSRWRALGDEMAALPEPPEAYGLIHNDLHAQNMLVHEGRPTIIDFDVAIYFWFASDIATGLHSALVFGPTAGERVNVAWAADFITAYLQGYRQQYALEAAWLRLLPLFLRYRDGLLYIVFSDVWGKPRNAWQERWLRASRRRILSGRPVVTLDWAAL